jgi:biopolymer transport protein ExbD
MMRRLVPASLLALLIVGATPSWAHDEFRFVGTLVKVELPQQRVSVKFKEADGKDETVQIALKKDTEITRDKKKIDRSQLKAGLSVVVDALGDDYDNLEAVEIRIVPPPSK